MRPYVSVCTMQGDLNALFIAAKAGHARTVELLVDLKWERGGYMFDVNGLQMNGVGGWPSSMLNYYLS